VSEIRQRAEWSAADFEQLCRSAGLMPGAARQAINDWALDRFDELLLEDEEPIVVNIHCLPPPAAAPQAHLALAGEPRVSA
ncbi:MAG: hypothetical protein J0H54_12835, partial [Rhizobiales bacterium]|nr:hypothetical protein [Hyphomicrobiales bacterium]